MSKENPKTLTWTVERKDDFWLWLDTKLPKRDKLIISASSAVIATLTLYGVFDGFFTSSGINRSLLSAMIYMLSTEFDYLSTVRTSRAVNIFERNTGIKSPAVETATGFPHRLNWDDLFSPQERMIQAALYTVGVLVPPIGVGIGTAKLYAGWINERIRALHERKLTEYLNG